MASTSAPRPPPNAAKPVPKPKAAANSRLVLMPIDCAIARFSTAARIRAPKRGRRKTKPRPGDDRRPKADKAQPIGRQRQPEDCYLAFQIVGQLDRLSERPPRDAHECNRDENQSEPK